MDIRYLAHVDDIEAVELRCSKTGCAGTLRIDVTSDHGLYGHRVCPRCHVRWASDAVDGEEFALLAVLCRYLKRERGAQSAPSVHGTAEVAPPAVVLVFPPPPRRD
jgi:hypothetical protein